MAINQSANKATTQYHAWVPQMPGYSAFKDKAFADMRTPEEQIWWLYAHTKNLPDTVEYNALKAQVSQLFELYNQLVEQGFDKYYEEWNKELEAWLTENAGQIYALFAKQVFFGLTDDGYFCAYVPDSWADIWFDTGAIYGTPEYGRLILGFDADGHPVNSARSDYKVLDSTVQSAIEAAAGNGISYSNRKLGINSGNGLAINTATNMVEVPIGENLRYTTNGIDVPDANDITRGVVKLTHDVNNLDGEEKAITSDGVFAYANSKYEDGISIPPTYQIEGISGAHNAVLFQGSIVISGYITVQPNVQITPDIPLFYFKGCKTGTIQGQPNWIFGKPKNFPNFKVFNYKDGVGLGVLSSYVPQQPESFGAFLTVPATYRKESV